MTVAVMIDEPAPLMVDGLSNLRDFGGKPTRGGLPMVGGRLYRSANLASVTDTGLDRLTALGLATVVDLRGAAERARALAAIAGDAIAIRSTPIEPKTSGRIGALLEGGAGRDVFRDLMIRSYRGYVGEAAEAFGVAIETLVLAADRPVLVHCTAGKDRTGFVVAVLQTALGVSEDDVLADYLATNVAWDRASVVGHLALDDDRVEPVLVADADYLAAAFEEIHRRDGGALDFIRRATDGRITPNQLECLLTRESSP